jgi:hypothetical protein
VDFFIRFHSGKDRVAMRKWATAFSKMTMLLVGAVVFCTTSSARADFEMRLSDGLGNSITIDQTTGNFVTVGAVTVTSVDISTPGLISFNGGVGHFNINVTSGESKPVLGIPGNEASMDLDSLDTSSSGGGTLTLTLADTDFSGPAGVWDTDTSIGGTLKTKNASQAASITAQAWTNPNNLSPLPPVPPSGGGAIPAGSVPIFVPIFSASTNNIHGSSFSGDATGSFTKGAGNFSMFLQDKLTFGSAGGTASFDHSADAIVPAPPGLLLALSGLPCLALGWLRRRKQRA